MTTPEDRAPTHPVTHGRCTNVRELGAFSVTTASYPPGLSVGRHEHAHPSWTFVTRGRFEEHFSRVSWACRTGGLLTKAAAAAHRNAYGPAGARCVIVEVRDERLVLGRAGATLFAQARYDEDGPLVARAHRAVRELACDDAASDVVLEGLLLEFAGEALRRWAPAPARERPWLRRVRDRLEAEFRSPLRVAALAAAVNVHPVYLCRAFRAAYGTTPGEYLRRLRIEWAERTLAHSDRPLAAIAAEAGFSDQSHFTREFRRHTGLTPARFRAHHRAL